MSKRLIEIGQRGEKLAGDFLRRKGMKIIRRNYRFDRGEIDIICMDKETLVFAEVKTRTNRQYGTPIEAVSEKKAAQIRKVAEGFLMEESNGLEFQEIRFDIVGILLEGNEEIIEHIENAF